MAGIFKVYLRPFDDDGVLQEFFDITKYVSLPSISDVLQDIDSADYQFGVFRFANMKMKVNNREGRFSDVENLRSFFRYKRGDSQIQITYRIAPPPICGVAIAGQAILGEEVELFTGLLNDESLEENAKQQDVSLTILGFESIFKRAKVPYADLSNGMSCKNALFSMLDQAVITDLLTVDLANIDPALDQAIDTVASFQNRTVKEALDSILVATNSVLFIIDSTIYITDREASAELVATYYGQASPRGPETVIDISNIKNGTSRVFNFITWSGTTLSDEDAESVLKYGIKKASIGFDFFTNNGKRVAILGALVDEFGLPKQELDLDVNLNYDTLAVQLLDRISIDYPAVLVPGESGIPICGVAEYDVDQVPEALWNLELSPDDEYKVLSKKISIKTQTIRFHLRRI